MSPSVLDGARTPSADVRAARVVGPEPARLRLRRGVPAPVGAGRRRAASSRTSHGSDAQAAPPADPAVPDLGDRDRATRQAAPRSAAGQPSSPRAKTYRPSARHQLRDLLVDQLAGRPAALRRSRSPARRRHPPGRTWRPPGCAAAARPRRWRRRAATRRCPTAGASRPPGRHPGRVPAAAAGRGRATSVASRAAGRAAPR